jgi:gamma-glutamyltranspeptidase/glutathione hydrolase
VDKAGDVVALTQTLLSIFGSKVMLPRTGVLMNNGVMWFDPRPGRPNSIAAGKRPLSNMCPVILSRADGQRFALGAAGGRRIMPAVFQLISFLVDYAMTAEAAAHHPRIDASGTPHVTVDAHLHMAVREALSTEHQICVEHSGVYPNYFACPSIACQRPDGTSEGAAFVMSPWAGAVAEA